MHRKQASVYDVARLLPSAVGGLVETEVGVLKRLTEDPERPYAVVLGGAKVSDKLGVIDNLLQTADRLLIGGGMVFTFLAAKDYEVGKSLLEADQVEPSRATSTQAKERGVEIVLPVDIVAATEFSADADHEVVAGRRDPGRPDGPGHRARVRRAVRREAQGLQDGLLERPDGRVRDGPVCRGHGCRRRGPRRGDREGRAHRRRWWRLRRGRAPARASRTTSSATSPPVAARAWSTSRARSSPA